MWLKFKKSNKWYSGPHNKDEDYNVIAGEPIEVNEYTAKMALDLKEAKECDAPKLKPNPAQLDKSKAEKNPAKKDKKESN